jgi:hypothetical protein
MEFLSQILNKLPIRLKQLSGDLEGCEPRKVFKQQWQ